MSINLSDVVVVHTEYHPADMYRKVGGYHTSQKVSDLVDSVFQPGVIIPTDISESSTLQFRKVALKNLSSQPMYHVKVYGFNNKNANYVKFALERDILGDVIVDGSEVIKDYRTAPKFTSDTCFKEIGSEGGAEEIGNGGTLSELSGQGIWLKMEIPKNVSDIASDQFCIGAIWTEVE
jgi:hypothetical protein